MQPVLPNDPPRTAAGTWPTGVSGNPAGKPKGAKDTRTQLAELLKQNGAALLQVAIDKARAGDPTMLHLCLSRLVPAVKAKQEPTPFTLDTKAPPTEQSLQVLAAVASGDLSVESGKALIDCITAVAGLHKFVAFEEELAKLQAHIAQLTRNANGQGGVITEPIEDTPV